MKSRLAQATVLVTVALFHLPGLQSSFHYDDGHSLLRNPHVRSLAHIPASFTQPQTFSENPDYAMYRPLVVVAPALNYAVTGYGASGFHLVNLVLHLGVT